MRYFRRVWASDKALVAPRALVNQVISCLQINRKKKKIELQGDPL